MRWPDGITDAMDMNVGKLWETVGDRKAWRPAAQGLWTVGHDGQLSKDKELCFCCLPNSLPRCDVFRQLKTSDRLQKQLPDWERYSPVTTKCNLRLLFGYTASHFQKNGARPSWNFTLCLFLFKMSLSVHFNKPPLQTYIYMGRENRKRAEHMGIQSKWKFLLLAVGKTDPNQWVPLAFPFFSLQLTLSWLALWLALPLSLSW